MTPGIDLGPLWSAKLAGELVGLSPSQRLDTGREMADQIQIAAVLSAIESGALDATRVQRARLQGAAVALRR